MFMQLLLGNLNKLFKLKFSNVKNGFSKFFSLFPKCCITVANSGSHTVCVNSLHQNAKLLGVISSTDYDYYNYSCVQYQQ